MKNLNRLGFSKLFFTLTLFLATFVASAEPMIPESPKLAAKSWVLMDADSGKIIAESDRDLRVPPASLTKMMTVYVADKTLASGHIKLEDEVKVSTKAWKAPGSRMFLKAGSSVKVRDLLKGVIIQSGNDASIALAEHIGGSEDAFVDLMNRQAQALGLKGTHFENATGLPGKEHYSTAYDMAILGKHIIKDFPESYAVYSEKEFSYAGINQTNRNILLDRDRSVDGIKTGHTEEAGYCLVASAQRDDMRLIAAVMGTNSIEARAQETLKLLSYGFRYYNTVKLYDRLQKLSTAKVYYGEQNEVALGLADDLYTSVIRGTEDKLSVKILLNESIKAPLLIGDILGKLEVNQGEQTIATLDLISLDNIEETGFFGKIYDWIRLVFAKIF